MAVHQKITHAPLLIFPKLKSIRFPFRWKITVPFLFLGLCLLVGGAFLATRIVFENANERFNNQLLEGGKIAAEWMVQEEDNLLESLRFLTYTSGVPEAMRDYDAGKLRALTYTIALNKGLEAAEFLDTHGKLVFSMQKVPDSAPENYQFVQEGDRSLAILGFVQKALIAESDARGNKFAGLVRQGQQTFFYVAGPVSDEQGRPVGAIMVGLSLKTLLAHMRDQTFARITFYQEDGQPLESVFSPAPGLDPTLADRILQEENKASYTRDFRALETDFVELISPWKARGENLGLVGISFSQPAFVNPSLPTRIGVFAFVFVVFILIILIGMLLANAITGPLIRLTKASQEVSIGNLDASVPLPETNDEVADLTMNFNHMLANLKQAQADILEAYDSTLASLSLAVEMREKETGRHSQRVTEISVRLAREMGLDGDDLVQIRRGALIHDIGKMRIPDSILNKPGPLTKEEFEEMKHHTGYAWELLSTIRFLQPALDIPLCHHEKWDGSGYPRGLAGEEIPLAARIFAVADVWDATTKDRVYRKALSREEALDIIHQGRDKHFDPRVVDAFLKILPELDQLAVGPADRVTQAFFEGIDIAPLD